VFYSNLGNENSNAGHIICSRGPQVAQPCSTALAQTHVYATDIHCDKLSHVSVITQESQKLNGTYSSVKPPMSIWHNIHFGQGMGNILCKTFMFALWSQILYNQRSNHPTTKHMTSWILPAVIAELHAYPLAFMKVTERSWVKLKSSDKLKFALTAVFLSLSFQETTTFCRKISDNYVRQGARRLYSSFWPDRSLRLD